MNDFFSITLDLNVSKLVQGDVVSFFLGEDRENCTLQIMFYIGEHKIEVFLSPNSLSLSETNKEKTRLSICN